MLHAGTAYFCYKDEPLACQIRRDGELNVDLIAGFFGLDSKTVKFNGETPPRSDKDGLTYRPALGGYLENDPIFITGSPKAGTVAEHCNSRWAFCGVMSVTSRYLVWVG